MLIHGSCHCGNIAFALDWGSDPAEIAVRACDCTFCTAHAAVWTSNRGASLRIRVADAALQSAYEFGTRTAQFRVCARCGIVPVVTCEIGGQLLAVVNVNTFRDVDPGMLRRAAAHFDDEDPATRLARRARGWIGDVAFVAALD